MLDYNDYPVRCLNTVTEPITLLIDNALALERNNQLTRKYLGASRLGTPCSRALQYEYVGSCAGQHNNFSGGTLRIFEAGHLFEELAARWLRLAGFTLVTEDNAGKQFGFIAAGGKIAGNIDGIIIAGPDVLGCSAGSCVLTDLGMGYPCLWEAKSMNNASFRDTAKKGLTLSKPVYAAQIALYQAYMEEAAPGISKNPALFTAINKNTCEIYHELIPFDADLAQRMSDKAVNIIKATEAGELLPRSFSSKEFYECRICAYKDRCWDG